jgi:xylulokinase
MASEGAQFLCIDAGTTRFKAAVVSQTGEILGRSDHLYAPGEGFFHEYRIGEFEGALKQTLRILSSEVDPARITACGITGHGPTLIPVGRDRKPLYTGVGYLDERVKKYIQRLTERQTDRITSTMYIPIALFFREEFPAIYERTEKFLQSFDYLAFLLTGIYTASSSQSGIKPWDEKSLEQSGLNAEKFPPVVYMGAGIGNVTKGAAKAFGIPAGIPVFAVGVDFAAALVGTDTMAKGKSCERSGSSGGINLCWDAHIKDNRILSYEHFMPELWNLAGITTTWGKALDWINRVLGIKETIFPERKTAAEEIIFFPYLKGERTPLWNPYAKGTFYGLTTEHTREDILFSVYLGIALSLRDCMQIIEDQGGKFLSPVVATGWGAKEDRFIQLKSDVTGKSFSKIQTEDAELLGIASVLAVSSGLAKSLPQAAGAIIREKKQFHPNEKTFDHYTTIFNTYKELQQKLYVSS